MKLFFVSCCDLTWLTAPLYMGACARTLRTTRHRKQQTEHHCHPNYRCHITAHHAHWTAPPTPVWSRHFRSGTTLVETGENFGRSSGSSFTDTFPVSKGVIWLFIATFAEVPPVVCPGSAVTLHFSHYSTLQVFISLNLNGIPPPPPNLSMMSRR